MMNFKERYIDRKQLLLSDETICQSNRDLFRRFLEFEEYKLQRQNQLRLLDQACYSTLYGYLTRLRNVNQWFDNKPWAELTKEDIKRVYDALEDGVIRTARGTPFADRRTYYNRIFRSKPFAMAGKLELVKEVMAFYADHTHREVKFLDEANFLKIVSVLNRPDQLLLCWLAWDIGENINSLLRLQKCDFARRVDPASREAEYLVNLPREKLKRSRQPRSEPTMHSATVRYADIVLASLQEDDVVFGFEYRQALKFLKTAMRRSGAVSSPRNQPVRWKDFRSGMACQMLKKGCTLEEVNARLGHKPSSREIDVYVTFLALDRRKPKQTFVQSNLREMETRLEAVEQRERVSRRHSEVKSQEIGFLQTEIATTQHQVQELYRVLRLLAKHLGVSESGEDF